MRSASLQFVRIPVVIGLALVLTLSQDKLVSAADDSPQPPPSDSANARCIVAAQRTCSAVATEMLVEIHTACGWFQWACNAARRSMNQPPEQDVPWVRQSCDAEAKRQCSAQFP